MIAKTMNRYASRDKLPFMSARPNERKLFRTFCSQNSCCLVVSPNALESYHKVSLTPTMPIECPPPVNKICVYEESALEFMKCQCRQSTWNMYHRIANGRRKSRVKKKAYHECLQEPCNNFEELLAKESAEKISDKIPLHCVKTPAEEGVFDIDL